MSDTGIYQTIATTVGEWRASHEGRLPARLQISSVYREECGNTPSYSIGDISIPIEYVEDTKIAAGAVRVIDSEIHRATSGGQQLPDWVKEE